MNGIWSWKDQGFCPGSAPNWASYLTFLTRSRVIMIIANKGQALPSQGFPESSGVPRSHLMRASLPHIVL